MYPYFFDRLGEIIDYQAGVHWPTLRLQHETAARIAYYHEAGISSGDKVIILHGNNAEFFADLFALWCLDACGVCLDANIGHTEFDAIARKCDARFVIYRGELPSKLTKMDLSSYDLLNTRDVSAKDSELIMETVVPFKVNLDQPAIILFTSGTTGDPKGVVHTLRTLIAKWTILPHYVPLEHMDVSLCLLPTHFGHGLICNCLYPLLYGKRLVILPKFNVAVLVRLGDIIDEHGVSYMSSVPAVWKATLSVSKRPMKQTLRLVTCGSAPLGEVLWKHIQEWAGTKRVWNTYGITEMGSWIAGTGVDEVIPQDGLIGPGWGTRILITHDQQMESGAVARLLERNALPPGEVGYVWLQSPTLMQGYYRQPDLTRSVICGSWFYTGDLGHMTPEGLLVLSGRVRNEINYAGMKVIPEDIDLVLERHEAILESYTFGLADEMAGEVVATAIVFKPGAAKHTSSELKSWASQHLSDYKVPTVWYEAAEIPKTPRGKVNRTRVAEYCKNRPKMK